MAIAKNHLRECSFCQASVSNVALMVTSDDLVNICDRCIELCVGVLCDRLREGRVHDIARVKGESK